MIKNKSKMTGNSSDNISEKDEKAQVNEYVNKAFELDPSVIQNYKQVKIGAAKEKGNDFMDFDDLLPHIGEFGRYQKILFLLMIPYASFLVFVYFTQIFITLVPEKHWCYVPELQNLSVDERFVFIVALEDIICERPLRANGPYLLMGKP